MREPDAFDAFYKDSRDRLLVQTFALTGDLTAARAAVREAYVGAWHRWRKVGAADDLESRVRPLAWRAAQRRAAGRVWHREKGLGPEARASLDILDGLGGPARRALLLHHLVGLPVEALADEAGLATTVATRDLDRAEEELAAAGGPAPGDDDGVLRLLEPLAAHALDAARWPRPSLVRRAGATRRRGRALAGAAVAVVVLVGSGFALGEGSPVQAGLSRDAPGATPSPDTLAGPPPPRLPAESLVGADQLDQALPARTWEVRRTTDNDEALGDRLPCQQARYADPDGVAALLRVSGAERASDRADLAVTQFTEASADEQAARAAYRTSLRWYSDCTQARFQLLSTKRPERLGDEALQFTLRDQADPVTTYVVGVARSGDFTTTTVLTQRSADAPNEVGAAQVLSTAVDRLCVLPGAGTCGPPQPELNTRSPLPVGDQPALVSELDLPPVSGVDQPWVGTEPRRAQRSVAATRCDQVAFTGDFEGTRFSNATTRSFVIPEDTALPEVFGIGETVAALPRDAADAFVARVRTRLADCPADDLGTEVEQLVDLDDGDRDAAVYRITVDVTDDETLTYFTAVMREGTAIGQISFVPGPDATLADGAFADLVARAMERMRQLPRPAS